MGRTSKGFSLLFAAVLAASNLMMVEFAYAQSIPKPSVPEFTIETVSFPYDVPTTNSIDPYTGKDITHPGYHVENKTTQIRIKNQPFTPYQIKENGVNHTINLCYNIRFKGHFSQEWGYYYLHNGSSDGNLRQDYGSEYTLRSIDRYLPSEGKIDFQVEAMVGYEHGIINPYGLPGTPRVITGEESGWSNIQTITIPDTTASASPNPTLTPTPSVPEFTIAIMLPLFVVIALIATVQLRKKRRSKGS